MTVMTMRTAFWVSAAAFVGPPVICIATPRTVPAWIRYTEDGLMLLWGIPASLLILCLLVVLVTPSRVLDRIAARIGERLEPRRKPAVVREVPPSNGIQVLGTFLSDDQHTFCERKYDIVRRIHGDDNASRLTCEQIEAEYDRYDRAETAASEDRCQSCDPDRVPAEFLVEAWDERRGDNGYIGEWLLCARHAEAKTTSVRRTGANATAEPMAQAHVDEFTADHYRQGGVR